MVVDVLGSEYTIYFDVPEAEMPEGADGCMDQSTRSIKIAKIEITRDSLRNMEDYKKKVLRHEITHAFLYESGLWSNSFFNGAWAQSEEITDWFAIQAPKLFRAFKEADAL